MKKILYIVWCLVAFISCQNEKVSTDSSLRLMFSVDTLRFDTVFTTMGSATKSVTIYNPNKNAVIIDHVLQDKQKYFYINFDGETQLDKMGGQINGGDSLILYVRVNIDPQDANSPVLVEDVLRFEVNGNRFPLALEAYGQDVEKIKSPTRCTTYEQYTFNNVKPYLIFDTVKVTQSLAMESGARLYFHQGGCLIAEGAVTIGSPYSSTPLLPYSPTPLLPSSPILCISDRIDNLFDKVPYAYAAGGWDGFYLIHSEGGPDEYLINGLEVVSGTNGLQLINADSLSLSASQPLSPSASPPLCRLTNCRIHNQAGNGLTIHNMDVEVSNTEVSNCAAYCVYLTGGKHTFIHSTIASYFNSTNVRIQSVPNMGLSAVYVDNADSLPKVTAEFMNCVIDGIGKENLVFAQPIDSTYEGRIFGNYIKAADDTARVFKNTYFEYEVYTYYDFHLADNSPARGIADSAVASLYDKDREGLPRDASQASAGCYEK